MRAARVRVCVCGARRVSPSARRAGHMVGRVMWLCRDLWSGVCGGIVAGMVAAVRRVVMWL